MLIKALGSVKSMHRRMSPFFIGTTTSPEHQSVGSVIGRITPISSILCSSALTFSTWGTAEHVVTLSAYGVISSCRTVSYGSIKSQSGRISLGYFSLTSAKLCIDQSQMMSLRASLKRLVQAVAYERVNHIDLL